MKKAEEYFQECFQNNRNIIDTIKQVQEDTIRETIEEFSITQKLKYYAGESGYLDKETILSVADKLIKEL